jgi:hypothetical protein
VEGAARGDLICIKARWTREGDRNGRDGLSTLRYRLTLEVSTPEGTRTGSGVVEFRGRWNDGVVHASEQGPVFRWRAAVELKRAVIALTDDPVTVGIDKLLPWATKLHGSIATGYALDRSYPDVSNQIYDGSPRRGAEAGSLPPPRHGGRRDGRIQLDSEILP